MDGVTHGQVKDKNGLIYKWRNMTRDVANELWIARENLSKKGGDRRSDNFNDANASLKSWSGYCSEIGINYTTANRWLNSWFPESLTLERKPLIKLSNYHEWLKEQEEGF